MQPPGAHATDFPADTFAQGCRNNVSGTVFSGNGTSIKGRQTGTNNGLRGGISGNNGRFEFRQF